MLSLRLFCHITRHFWPVTRNKHYFHSNYAKTFVLGLPRLNQALFPSKVFVISMSTSESTNECNHCLSCGEPLKLCHFKCPRCGHFHKPEDTRRSYFQIFEEEQMYKLDEEQLKQKFRYLQSEYHPDKFATKDENERNISEQVSSFINKAYTTLTNPYERGVYLLKLNGIEMSESDTEKLDKEFLMEIMELNEEVEQIKDAAMLSKFEEDNDKKIKFIANDVAIAFKSRDYLLAKSQLQRMKYYISLRKRIRERKKS